MRNLLMTVLVVFTVMPLKKHPKPTPTPILNNGRHYPVKPYCVVVKVGTRLIRVCRQ